MAFTTNRKTLTNDIESLIHKQREYQQEIQALQTRISNIEELLQAHTKSPDIIKQQLNHSLHDVGAGTEDAIEYITQTKDVFAKLDSKLLKLNTKVSGADQVEFIVDYLQKLLSTLSRDNQWQGRIDRLHRNKDTLLERIQIYEGHLRGIAKKLDDITQAHNDPQPENMQLIAQIEKIPFVVPGSVYIPSSEDFLQFNMTPLRAYPVGEPVETSMSLPIPETTIRIPAGLGEKITIDASDPTVPHPYIYSEPSIHPHVMGIHPCLGDFSPAITEMRDANDVVSLIYLLREYLSVFDPDDDAGQYWVRGVLTEHAPSFFDDTTQPHVISKFVPHSDSEFAASFVVMFDASNLPTGIYDSMIIVKADTMNGGKLTCWAMAGGASETNKLVRWMNEHATALIFKDGAWKRTSFITP